MKDAGDQSQSTQEASEDEEDFMSDKYIIEAAKVDRIGVRDGDKSSRNEGYTEQRRRKLNDDYDRGKILPRAQREREARQKGLAKNLFGEFDEEEETASTSNKRKDKAMRTMLAMGFKPGEALEPAIPTSKPLIDPLNIDERWLDPRNKRSGIGIAPRVQSATAAISKDIDRAIDHEKNASSNIEEDFRIRNRAAQEGRHNEALLVTARKTCQELDSLPPYSMTYSPLWINPEALKKSKHDLPVHKDEEKQSSSLPGDDDPIEQQDEEKQVAVKRADDARRFCFLPSKARLQITLSHLKRAHHYCLYCGHRYASEEELDSLCPGEDEEDH
ncbi:uncharacterized protein FA14DRAFT_121628 [Meira miltonrushii]|uniref:DUF4187 domain-containing protein n=1 Tax=Meira miltonrushii TaxID=1280837 RepID=A0A316VFZ5_9BASI|nr:uncharacterized protein FA14DRAFT_121628 [Meira miltonrushii]PWN34921.1 hypothetical protein FA14DRAFT_121628 [Meira miltonrushii]